MNARKHEEYHIRRLEQQMLDALLRIEELLIADRHIEELLLAGRGDIEEGITNLSPTETPFSNLTMSMFKSKADKAKAEREDVFDPDGHKVGSVTKGKRK